MISVYVMIQYRCSACHVTGKELKMLTHETVLGNRIGKGVKQSEMFNYSVYSRLGNKIICFEQKYKNSKMNSTENCHFTYHVSLKKLMQQGICNPEFYGDLVYKFKKIIGNPNFSNLLKRIVNRFKRAGYSLDIMRQTASLVFNPIMVEGYAALFSCTAVVQASDSMTASM